ncbi:hypothetical protein GCM10028805_37960 [Spirosoma harenae]
MKTLSTLLLVAVSFGALAQRSSSKHISTDGRHLRIRVDMDQPGRSIHYNRSFDVIDMEASAIKALETSIVDSLEQAFNEQSMAVAVSTKHEKRKAKKSEGWGSAKAESDDNDDKPCAEQVAVASSYGKTYGGSYNKTYDVDAEAKATPEPSFSPSEVNPSSVLVKEDKENGRLWMQYKFVKDGEELVIERTANVIGKSEREKQAIIRETERSFGIKTGNQ